MKNNCKIRFLKNGGCHYFFYFFISIIVLSCITGYSGDFFRKPTSKKLEKWGNAPDFTLPIVGGGKFTLSSLKGKIIILDFWATWCQPCRQEIPDFIALKEKYKKEGLEIVGISLDEEEAPVEKFSKKMGINYILVMGDENTVKKYGGIKGIPTTFIIAQNGNIVAKYIGYRPKKVFENGIKKLLENKPKK